jgi:predicted Fe-S protein YdhL (DUF1289 family)
MIESPCIKKCELRNNRCIACGRTIEEISNWKTFTDDQKVSVLARIRADTYWPDICFPPINLLVLHSAKWNNFK